MKILINTPSIHDLGGVANHYLGLKSYWTQRVRYNQLGAGKARRWLVPITIIKFVWHCLVWRPEIVVLNPSMGGRALKRDFMYLRFAKWMGRRVAVFIHGFNLDYASRANWQWIGRNLNKADGVIVLAQAFKDILESHGITAPIRLSTTKVLDTLVEGFDPSCRTGEVKNLLFLARIERAKGVYEAADTFALLRQDFPHLTLTFVGDGTELPALKQHVKELGIEGIRFTGALSGDALRNEYLRANFFFFFTSYGEGMPTVVLEAMAFGLPVVTRKVGGLVDFFEDGQMGRITDSLQPRDFATLIRPYLTDSELVRRTSLYNHQYAKEHFMASRVAQQVEGILNGFC